MGIFASPLSNEYLLAAEHFKLGRDDLIEICNVAIETIFGGEQEKKKIRDSLSVFQAEAAV